MKKFLILLLTVISLISVGLSLSACNVLDFHKHEWSTSYFESGDQHFRTCKTCNEKEYSQHSYDSDNLCTYCKKKYINSSSGVCIHEYGEWKNDGESHTRTCSKCNIKQTVRHEYPDNPTKEQTATCTRDGYKEYTCPQCKSVKKETIAKLAHPWNSGAVKMSPTCKTEGIRLFVCTACGETREDAIAKIAHTPDAGKITKAATCKEPGVKTFTCKKCGEVVEESIPKTTTHVMDRGVVEKQETCKEEGIKVYTCTICGTKTRENLPKIPFHEWGNWVAVKAATCQETGSEKATCTRCGEVRTRDIPKYTTHKWDSGRVTREPTCQVEGEKTFTCGYGNETKVEPIAKLTRHEWDNGVVTQAPTCKDYGIKTFTCAIGKETRTENVAKLTTHKWGAWTSIDIETHKRVCGLCSNIEEQSQHTVTNGVCSGCGFKYGIVIGDLRYEIKNQTRAVGSAVATVLGANTLRPTSVTIPSTVNYGNTSYSVTAIAADAFRNVSSLQSDTPTVTIPNSIRTIGAYAFANTGMTVNTIPASVIEVGDGAFQRCKSRNLVVPATVTTWGEGVFAYSDFGYSEVTVNSPTIGVKMFANCTLIDVKIGASVRTISREAFAGTDVVKVRIEIGLTKIEKGAFTNRNTNFDYNGTKTQWDAITKETGFHTQNTYYIHTTQGSYHVENGVESQW